MPCNLSHLPTVPSLTWDDCRLLVESVVDYAIFMLDVEGYVATWNAGAERIKGYRAEEVIGRHFSAFYPPEDIADGKPQWLLEVAGRLGRVEDEGWRLRKDGSRFWANVVITALRDEAGVLRGFGKVTRDQSDRRAAEEELRESEQRFHSLVDAVVDYAIFMLDEAGRVKTWNPGARRLKGYEPDQIIGRHFGVFYPQEDRERGRPEQILATVRREGHLEDEGWRVRRDGSRFWADVVITALRGPGGELRGFAKVTRDLTARRKAEETLRRSEERFRLLVENIGDYAIYMLDPQGRVASWNLGAQKLKGYAAAEIVGQSFSTFFSAQDKAARKPQRELDEARRHGRFEDEGWRVRKDGTRFWANAILTAVYDERGKLLGFAKITRDLSARREAEENERAVTAAEQASRAKDEFLATVSHELRTPLSAILGWATILKDRVTDPSLVKPLQSIHRNAQAQVRIIEDILDVSRIIAGKFSIEPKPSDLLDIVRQAVDTARPSASAKSVSLDVDCDGGLWLLLVDPERMLQVIGNLLSNAVKFTPSGGVVCVSFRRAEPGIELRISDTGVGIDSAFLPLVFERFRQADSTATRSASGLGLGLAIVKHIVDLHRGTVEASSPGRGQGATFVIRLPLDADARPTSEGYPAARTAPTVSPGVLKGLRVLVVDDAPDAREVIVAVLEQGGAVVESAASSAEGLTSYQRFHPNVILSDIAMPGEDGFAFLRKLRDLPGASEVPVLALTASARAQDRAQAIAAGFREHLAKPIEPAVLTSAVAAFRSVPKV